VRGRGRTCQCGGKCRRTLKFQAGVGLAAFGAGPLLHFAADDIEVVATQAAKRGAAAFALEAGVVAVVVVEPEAEEERGDQETVDDGGDLQTHETGSEKGMTEEKAKRAEDCSSARLPNGAGA